MRILIAVKPRLYREALALSLHQSRPDAEVMLGPPGALDGEAKVFGPHLLVYNDGAVLGGLAGVLCRIEVLYSDGMDARTTLDGRDDEVKDITTQDLLALMDEVEKLVSKEEAE